MGPEKMGFLLAPTALQLCQTITGHRMIFTDTPILIPEPGNVTLCGKKTEEMIKDAEMGRLFWII